VPHRLGSHAAGSPGPPLSPEVVSQPGLLRWFDAGALAAHARETFCLGLRSPVATRGGDCLFSVRPAVLNANTYVLAQALFSRALKSVRWGNAAACAESAGCRSGTIFTNFGLHRSRFGSRSSSTSVSASEQQQPKRRSILTAISRFLSPPL
jgi:hypothetical protein